MSKKVLLFCTSLVGACFAVSASENSGEIAARVENAQTDVEVPQVHELPGIRITDGPVVVDPSYGCSEENVRALAHIAVRAMHATLSDVSATIHRSVESEPAVQVPAGEIAPVVAGEPDNKVEKAGEELGEAVVAVQSAVTEIGEAVVAVQDAVFNGSIMSDYIPALTDFVSSNYHKLVEWFKACWKFVVYNSVNKATRHIVLSVGSRSPVDLSALAKVDEFAGESFGQMQALKRELLDTAEQSSPQLRKAVDLYLGAYENWFRGNADTFLDVDATREMLECLGVTNVDASAFTSRNMEHFRSLGGEIRHANLFLIVAPGAIATYEATPLIAQASEADVVND